MNKIMVGFEPTGHYWLNLGQYLESSGAEGRPELTPSKDILRLYKELGGRIITVGSDSHAPAHLGTGIKEQLEELKKIGFTEICTFEKMKPIFHKI